MPSLVGYDAGVAWMMLDDDDVPPSPVHVVFRVDTSTVMKRVTNSIVCPAENGTGHITCERCQWCTRESPNYTFRKEKAHVR